MGEPRELHGGEAIECVDRLARAAGQLSQACDEVAAGLLGEARQQRVPHAVSEKSRLVVRRVLAPLDPRRHQRGHGVPVTALEQRADQPAAHRRNPGDTADARTLEQPHDQRLCLVVGGVAERDSRRADAVGGRLQRRVPRGARRRLDRAGGHPYADDLHRHAEARAEGAHVLSVARGVGPETVVGLAMDRSARLVVQDVQAQAESGRQAEEDVEQGDGVGAAGDADQDGFAAPEHRVAANGGLGGVDEVHAQPPCRPTQTSPSSKCSFFHTGTVRLSVSIA